MLLVLEFRYFLHANTNSVDKEKILKKKRKKNVYKNSRIGIHYGTRIYLDTTNIHAHAEYQYHNPNENLL